MGPRNTVSLLFLLFSLVFAACSGESLTPEQQEQSTVALKFIDLIGNYSPENAEQRFRAAREMLAEEARPEFDKKVIGVELAIVKKVGRSQQYEIWQDGISVASDPTSPSLVSIPGDRIRSREGRTSPPVEMTYQISLVSNGVAGIAISKFAKVYAEGQEHALKEEKMLESYSKVWKSADGERKRFSEAVEMVNKDLKAHEKKVEKDFEKLSNSLDRLGGTVRELGKQAVEMNKKRAGALIEPSAVAAPEVSPVPEVSPAPTLTPLPR